jgi:hypothetical protein
MWKEEDLKRIEHLRTQVPNKLKLIREQRKGYVETRINTTVSVIRRRPISANPSR